jgi:heme exporter protein B
VTAVAVFAARPSSWRLLTAQLRRDVTISFRSPGDVANPLVFYLIGIALFPLGVGPSPERLAEMAPGVLWVLALLSTLLALDGLFRRDYDDGTLEQLTLHADPLFVGVLAKVAAHWTVTGLPLTLFAPVGALLLNLDGAAVPTLMVTLLLGTPVLSVIGAVGAALTVGLRRGGLLLALIVLPLYVPVLILGSGAVAAVIDGVDPGAQIAWLAALLALSLTLAPFAAAQGLRIGLE